jgi:cytochrome P450/NADPH-cytochrome P450 reductase
MVYYLLKNPETLRKLRAEIDEVLGDRPVQYEHLGKLKYLTGMLIVKRIF